MTFLKQFNEKSDILMDRLRSFADGKRVVDLFPELNHTALDAINLIAFGLNTDCINEKDKRLSDSISDSLRVIGLSFEIPFYEVQIKKKQFFFHLFVDFY